jgi:N-acetylneuraminic acid mutarotase
MFFVDSELRVNRLSVSAALATGARPATQIVFFESSVPDYQVLQQGMDTQADSVVLDSGGDGLREMAAFLADRHDLTTVGIVAHGSPGAVCLGTTTLDERNLVDYTRELGTVGSALGAGGELDLWSCAVGNGEQGKQLLKDLAAATGSAVAAADQPVGAADLGGSWHLAVGVGGVQAEVPFSVAAREAFHHSLGAWILAASMITARYGPTASLLGNGKVLVAGGDNPSSYTTARSSAELYDPISNTWSSAGPMATPRGNFTATLLGNGKVLVAGGYTGGNAGVGLASAELYDPGTNTWSAAGSMASARAGHTATLLLDGKVLVVDGLARAELYDPASNTWSAAGAMAVPQHTYTVPLDGHTATLLPNGKVLVTGGADPLVGMTTEIYDPASNTWSLAVPMIVPRQGATATLLASGEVLVAGGQSSGAVTVSAELYDPLNNSWSAAGPMAVAAASTATLLKSGQVLVTAYSLNGNSAQVYDPVRNTWSLVGSMAFHRYGDTYSATLLKDGKVLVVGGGFVASGGEGTAELFDPDSPTPPLGWKTAAPMPVVLSRQAATLLGNGKVLVTGLNNAHAVAELYDPATDIWTSAAPMLNDSAAGLPGTLLANGKVLQGGQLYDPLTNTWSATSSIFAGGEAATLLSNGNVLVGRSLYDPIRDTWSSADSGATFRTAYTATLLGNGKVLVTGGMAANGSYVAATQLYDPASNTWSAGPPMAAVRGYHNAILLPNGKVLVAGGDSNVFANSIQTSAELYDPVTNTWSAAGSMATGRMKYTMTLLKSGKVLVTGGTTSVGNGWQYTSSAEVYDPATNTWSSAGFIALNRTGHTATLLNNGTVLVVGGDINPTSGEVYLGNSFTFGMLSGNTVVAGTGLFTVQTTDPFGQPLTNLGGPFNITITSTSLDSNGTFSLMGPLNSSGFGFFVGPTKAGTYRLVATTGSLTGTSANVTVTPADASYFTVSAPLDVTTGDSFNVTVTAFDHFGNIATGYSGTVKFTSSDPVVKV